MNILRNLKPIIYFTVLFWEKSHIFSQKNEKHCNLPFDDLALDINVLGPNLPKQQKKKRRGKKSRFVMNWAFLIFTNKKHLSWKER